MNQFATTDRSTMNSVAISTGANGSSLAPQSLAEVVRFAEVMCRADIALPKHLRGNAGACMAVAMQALEWQMSPFAVASKSYAVNGAIAYEAQLIAAVVNTRSGIKGRLKYAFEGTGAEMTCTVTGTLDGEECTYTSPTVGSIPTKNSPLWKSDPQQQLGYFSARSWARRHCPEVILGVYDRDEAQQFQGADNAKDVTPSVMQRLQAKQDQTSGVADEREGFNADHVTRETETLTGGTDTEQETSSDIPSSDEKGSGDQAPRDAAADPSASNGDESEAGAQEAADGQSAASASHDLSDEDREWLTTTARMLWAATSQGEQDLLKATFDGIRENQTPETISRAARDKGNSIFKQCKLVCFGEADSNDTLELIAGIAGVEPEELVNG